ncbi:cytochrome c oxidase assembly protein [soil metagenome]
MTFAHAPIHPSALWQAWTFDPLVVVGLVAGAALYARGSLRLREVAPRRRAVHARQTLFALGGWLCLLLALVSPIDALGGTIFTAHMVQHLLLILGAAPLLVLGAPSLPLMLALPNTARRAMQRVRHHRVLALARRPARSWVIVGTMQAAVLWAWHLPVMYEAALQDDRLHALEHASFFVTAWLFWSIVVRAPRRGGLGHGAAILFVFATALQSGALGAVLTFAARPLYPLHAVGARWWGLTALGDQQLAGAMMWVPGGMVYLLTIALLFVSWMKYMEKRMNRDERFSSDPVVLGPQHR